MSADDLAVSKSQLDKLGSRLRNSAEPSDDDLVLLDRYRERFIGVNDAVVRELRALTEFTVESRHKSVPSIVAKLRRRQPARLSAVQDIAGARIIVPHLGAQDELVQKIARRYTDALIDDKRAQPTYSYRAVHVIINATLPYEIQVRTRIQHNWAQLSERLADRYGFQLKYGGGPQDVAAALADFARLLAGVDQLTSDPYKEADLALIGMIQSYVERLPAIAEALKIQ